MRLGTMATTKYLTYWPSNFYAMKGSFTNAICAFFYFAVLSTRGSTPLSSFVLESVS